MLTSQTSDPRFRDSGFFNMSTHLEIPAPNGDVGHVNEIGPVPHGKGTTSTHRSKISHTRREPSPYLRAASIGSEEQFDLICVGFGPASLAVAVALHDALSKQGSRGTPPKVLFIEKQDGFAWHAGMLLPGAKMQISFVKDLATLRDPRSDFTFLNYLHSQDRLVDFTNLDTFLPARIEYEDYMRWAASAFRHVVQYGHQVVSVTPENQGQGPTESFTVKARNTQTGQIRTCIGRNVLIASGGQPSLPPSLPVKHPRVIHSSQYAYLVPRLLTNPNAPYRVTVIGAGQSAAEIFNNVQTLYPNSQTRLVMRQEFLRPSDDSPL
jgi:L-ornithine N5-oxygenase